MNRNWTSSISAVLLAAALTLTLPACGEDSEGDHAHVGDSHSHEQAASHENGNHGQNADHAHEDTSRTRLDTSGMNADSTREHGDEGHSHDGEEHSHE